MVAVTAAAVIVISLVLVVNMAVVLAMAAIPFDQSPPVPAQSNANATAS